MVKNSKRISKLSLGKETLRVLRSNELSIAQGGQLGQSVWVRCPGTTDPSVLRINCTQTVEATCTEGSGNSCPSVERCGSTVD